MTDVIISGAWDDFYSSVIDVYSKWDDGRISGEVAIARMKRVCESFLKEFK